MSQETYTAGLFDPPTAPPQPRSVCNVRPVAWGYLATLMLLRCIAACTMRVCRHGAPDTLRGGYLLACAHLSHTDPVALCALWPRPIHWMARIECFRRQWAAWVLRRLRAFPVRRGGVPVRTVRTAVQRLKRGTVVGVFPEGEVRRGRTSVLHGGTIKRGVCLLALHSGRPIVPCLLLGTPQLQSVSPYLPARRGRLWLLCGEPIWPPCDHLVGSERRQVRLLLAARVEAALRGLYQEAQRRWPDAASVRP